MRIAHITATFPPYRGGTGAVCYHNARELARRGHDVHVWTARIAGAAAYEQHDGITIHRVRPVLRIGNAPMVPHLIGHLRGFDLIHLHYPFFGGECAAAAAHLYRIPLVVTYHQDVLLRGSMGWIERGLRGTLGRAMLRSADRLLFTSHDYAQASHARPLLRGREQYLGALPNGVDTTRFAPSSTGDPHTLPYAATDQIALLVAGLDRAHYFKGVDVFLHALIQLPAAIKGVIVGDGDLRPHYEAATDRLDLQGRVYFAGRVPDTDLPGYYRRADVTVLPSVTMGEAFGLVLIESFACGTPVIASDLPGVRTVVDHGNDGLLVPPTDPHALADALRAVLNDHAARRQAMGARGRAKIVARYDWTQIGTQLEAIYRDVLTTRGYTYAGRDR